MKCISCNSDLPNVRISLGYKECVSCSTVDTYGCVDIVYHKTGNTVQVMSKSAAAEINKHKRRGFGTMLKGGSKSSAYNPKGSKYGVSTCVIGSEASYNKVGEISMSLFENKGIDSAFDYIDRAVINYDINKNQAFKLKSIFKSL
jgi:hypothetical protein